MIKSRKITALMLSLLVMFSSCTKVEKQPENNKNFEKKIYTTQRNCDEDGIYMICSDDNSNDRYLTYTRYRTGETEFLCSKEGCNHNNNDCDAYFTYMDYYGVMSIGGYAVFVTNNNIRKYERDTWKVVSSKCITEEGNLIFSDDSKMYSYDNYGNIYLGLFFFDYALRNISFATYYVTDDTITVSENLLDIPDLCDGNKVMYGTVSQCYENKLVCSFTATDNFTYIYLIDPENLSAELIYKVETENAGSIYVTADSIYLIENGSELYDLSDGHKVLNLDEVTGGLYPDVKYGNVITILNDKSTVDNIFYDIVCSAGEWLVISKGILAESINSDGAHMVSWYILYNMSTGQTKTVNHTRYGGNIDERAKDIYCADEFYVTCETRRGKVLSEYVYGFEPLSDFINDSNYFTEFRMDMLAE